MRSPVTATFLTFLFWMITDSVKNKLAHLNPIFHGAYDWQIIMISLHEGYQAYQYNNAEGKLAFNFL